MADACVFDIDAPAASLNVSTRLADVAAAMPDAMAVVCPRRFAPRSSATFTGHSGNVYSTTTFAELDADAARIAGGLVNWGVPTGTRLALLVRPGIEFVALVFGLLRAGIVIVLVDPGLGRRNLLRCLAAVEPEGFVGIGTAQAVRVLLRHRFPRARWNVTVGRRWFWRGPTLDQIRRSAADSAGALSQPALAQPVAPMHLAPRGSFPATSADDPAAIIFTSGSTGPPKGVLYTQRMFDTQIAEIQAAYGIEPGGIDLACFPLFGLFNAAMGVTTVFPEMDFSRPAAADPRKLMAAANDWQVTQAFASPAVWRIVSEHCAKTGTRIPTLRQVFSCGAPVPARVLKGTLACVAADAKMHTPYGATECLPVSTIEGAEVLGETAVRTDTGAGVCVGRKFDSIEWRIIRITDEPIDAIGDIEELAHGEVGELIVRGPQVSPEYVTSIKANTVSKIHAQRAGPSPAPADSTIRHAPNIHNEFWHRTGDVGYLDETGRFWYCGRKSQRVETADGTLFTECVEAVFIAHPAVVRCALVGVGSRGRQTPVLVVERDPTATADALARELLEIGRSHEHTRTIAHILFHPRLPVDVRHNAKINREWLAQWATKHLAKNSFPSPAPSAP